MRCARLVSRIARSSMPPVVSYFNYVNRIADGLGVELERTWPDDVRRPRRYPPGRNTAGGGG